jgi:AcrR family transcriptional regulator
MARHRTIGTSTAAGPNTPAHAASRGRGRPRDPQLDAAILTAAGKLLAYAGYATMSLEAIAALAGTTMPALRRRYDSKADLVAAVIVALRTAPVPAPTERPREDALAVLRGLNRALLHGNAMTVVGSLLAEEHHHPELLNLFRTNIVDSRRGALRDALIRGMRAAQLPADLDVDAITSMLCGALYGQYLTVVGLDDDWADRTLDVIWP